MHIALPRRLLAVACASALSASAHADYCFSRAEIEPGSSCDDDPAPEVGFWDALGWTARALSPNTCNPTDLRGIPPSAALTATRNRATEKRIVLLGDLLASPEERVPWVDPQVRAVFASADLIVANVEAPVDPRSCWDPAYDPTGNFDASASFLRTLFAQYGIAPEKTVVTLANNHTGDQGTAAVGESVVAAEGLGLRGVVGALDANGAPRVGTYDLGALRVGVVGWTEVENCKAYTTLPDGTTRTAWPIGDDITGAGVAEGHWAQTKAAQGIDLLIGSVHWGEDFYTFPQQSTRDRARTLAARGFDLLAGHHPHVLQPAEHLGAGDMVFYSLGSASLNWALANHTLTPVVEVWVSEQGAIVEYKVHPFVYQKVSSKVSIPCRAACPGSTDTADACRTEWRVIPLSAVSNTLYVRSNLEDEVERVFPTTP